MARKKGVTQKRAEQTEKAAIEIRKAAAALFTLAEKVRGFSIDVIPIGEWEDDHNQAIEDYNAAREDVANLATEIEETVSNMEEKFSGTERYQNLSSALSSLQEADVDVTSVDSPDIEQVLEEYASSVEDLGTEMEGAADTLENIDWSM